MIIKQISFDFWNTLFRANPAYGEARNKYLTESYFNCNGLSPKEVYAAYKRVDNRIDWLIDRTGFSYVPVQLYGMVAHELGCYHATDVQLQGMGESFAEIFQLNPSIIYSPETLPVLRELSQRGYGINIGSNTGFIPGRLLREVCLVPLGINFNFGVYSDEITYAKPHERFFKEIHDKSCDRFTRLLRRQILHVGDNSTTDLTGALTAGMDAMLINNGTTTITDVLHRLSYDADV